jgi:asparagine synthase (glutamine-hydrolysing)
MCGIAGAAWNSGAEPLTEETLRRMTSVLAHRGPDDAGVFLSNADSGNGSRPGVALGHRRLSIIDLENGHQPLANEDDSVWVAFNGEIYDHETLRSRLEGLGHRFTTQTDTEVIVHLYEQYGLDFVQHLRGMFAFALWDARRERLVLVRDRLGQKPLVYRHVDRRVLFASELKALLQVPGASRELDPAALDMFLMYQYVPHPHCILRGYHKLPPGHLAVFEEGRLDVRRYWSPCENNLTTSRSDAPLNYEQGCEQLRTTLTEAVRLRMSSDVPLGAFLSGGVDSTIITGLMQELSDSPVHTFSIGFPVKQFDETQYAREAARKLGTEHHEFIVEPSALDTLPRLIWHYDEPFADSSAIPTMHLSEVTRREVTVALSGDGGDELFAGYDRYRAVRLAAVVDRLPWPLRRVMTSRIWQKIPASVRQKSFRRRAKRWLAALGESLERRYLKWIGIFDTDRLQRLYSPEFRERLGTANAADFLLDRYSQCPQTDIVARTTCVDVLSYLPCDILTKVDIASMSHSLECRSPFLDHHVAELAMRMPIDWKLKGRQSKRILIDTFADLLPESIKRRRKMGFGVPLDHWFRHELRGLIEETLLDPSSLNRGYFDPAEVRRLIHEHVTSQWDHSYRLWSLLCFEMWQRMFLDPATVPSSCPESA